MSHGPRPVRNGRPILAAGAVLWRAGEAGPEVALVHRPKYDDWSLPKGKLDPWEQLLETAVREVAEETGFRVALGRPLGVQRYAVNGVPKEVHYWAAEAREGAFAPHHEIDELVWVDVETAKERVTRGSDTGILDAFANGPVRTSALLLLRHAKASPRDRWHHDDDERPLDPLGVLQARLAVPRLAAFAPTRVVTSPAVRCASTTAPYAERHPVEVAAVRGLSEDGYDDDPDVASRVVLGLLVSGENALVCSHRPVLLALQAMLTERADVPVPGDELAPMEFLALHVADRRIVAVERHDPTT